MKVKIKRSGSIFIGTTVFLGVAAANTGNNLLYILVSSMLALMLVSGFNSILNIRGIDVRLIPPKEVFKNRRARFRVVVKKRGKLPSFLIRLGSDVEEIVLPMLSRGGYWGYIDMLFDERGRVGMVSLRVSSDFPLGMFVRSVDVKVKANFVVFPEPLPAEIPLMSSNKPKRGSSSRVVMVKGFEELKNIREYAGEPIKLVHWKLSAKENNLMVREMLEEEKEPVMLSLEDVSGDLETKLSKLAYLAIKLIEEGYPVGLKIGDKEIPPDWGEHQKLLILSELALY